MVSVNGTAAEEMNNKYHSSDSESDWGLSGDEVDDMLDEALPEDFRRAPKIRKLMPSEQDKIKNLVNNDSKNVEGSEGDQMDADDNEKNVEDSNKFTEKVVTILEEKGKSKFEDLPGGWIQVRHVSGMPVYLHRKTRVCTVSKPYRLGPGSARKHAMPLSAIPCLAYRKALEREANGVEEAVVVKSTSDLTGDKEAALKTNEENESEIREKDVVGKCETEETATPMDFTSDVFSTTAVFSNADSVPIVEVETPVFENRDSVNCESTNILNQCDTMEDDLEPGEILDDDDNNEEELSRKKLEINESGTALKSGTGTAKKPTTSIQHRLGLNLDNKIPGASSTGLENLKNLIPKAQVETAQAANEMNTVTPDELREYCKAVFTFKEVTCKRFRSWSDRRKHAKEQKRMHLQRPVLPDGLQLITFPVQRTVGDSDSGKTVKEEYTMNFQGKSSVCILHEYVQHALRLQPSYTFGESRNSAAPYAATVMINNVQYGSGVGTSKKLAKASAASATLEILIPAMKDFLKTNGTTNNDMYHISYFDQVELDDPRIPKMCASVSEPSPYALLLACLQRNFGQGSTSDIKFEVISTGSQANRFRMQTGEYSVEVTASNKREGKQLASQALLCKIHPHIKNFGSFLRLYGNGSVKSVKEKKQEEQQITTLQSKASANSPNYAILNKLREEMLKLRAKRLEESGVKNGEQVESTVVVPSAPSAVMATTNTEGVQNSSSS